MTVVVMDVVVVMIVVMVVVLFFVGEMMVVAVSVAVVVSMMDFDHLIERTNTKMTTSNKIIEQRWFELLTTLNDPRQKTN